MRKRSCRGVFFVKTNMAANSAETSHFEEFPLKKSRRSVCWKDDSGKNSAETLNFTVFALKKEERVYVRPF